MRRQLAEVAEGKRFLLQGGDCAERFADCNSSLIENKLRILLQVSRRGGTARCEAVAVSHLALPLSLAAPRLPRSPLLRPPFPLTRRPAQMSLVLTWGARMPTLRIGRMAGQYSKPRSADMETVEGGEAAAPAPCICRDVSLQARSSAALLSRNPRCALPPAPSSPLSG